MGPPSHKIMAKLVHKATPSLGRLGCQSMGQLLLTAAGPPPGLATGWGHSQHQVAALELAAIECPACQVRLLSGFLPVFECRLRRGLEHLIRVGGQLLMEDTFLSKYTWSEWDSEAEGPRVKTLGSTPVLTPGRAYPGKEGCVQLVGEVSRVLFQEAGGSKASALQPAQCAIPNRAALPARR